MITWPEHKCGLHVTHNQHKDYYETVEQALGTTYNRGDFESDAKIDECIRLDSVWSMQWYPDTPVGFYVVCAPTFEEALERALGVDHG